MNGEPLVLSGDVARSWTDSVAGALRALRLNQHFPPWARLAEWVRAMAACGEVRLDRDSGLPTPREWVRIRVGRELADTALADLAALDSARLPVAEALHLDRRRREHLTLRALPPLPPTELQIGLRNVDDGRASWLVRMDRFDPASATVARYTLVVADRAGRDVRPTFEHQLSVLSSEDAALAFAVLRDQQGLDVEEVVRGVVGPGVIPGEAGPDALRGLLTAGPLVSACLERASLDVAGGHVDDPLVTSVVVPSAGARFGMSRQRKWAVAEPDTAALKAWLAASDSRNLVYGYPPV